MSTSSYKLPDLTGLTRPFELRANKNCRAVSLASEKWLLEPLTQSGSDTRDRDTSERDALQRVNAQPGLLLRSGLLAALFYPTCDAPQLRLVTDFLGLLVCSNDRVIVMRQDPLSQWAGEDSGRQEGTRRLAISDNMHFRRLTTRLSRLADHAHPSWISRFNHSTRAFRAAQLQVFAHRKNNAVPDLESFLELRRDSSGLRMMFDLLEIAEGLVLPGEVVEGDAVGRLGRCAMDIIALSMDILSYKLDYSRGNKHNLISVLRSEKGLSLQGTMNFAGILVKQSIDAFITTERLLTSAQPPFSSSAWDDRTANDIRMYVQGFRDCIAGSIHWGYDSEMFFGSRVDDVRAFGWVFLSEKQPDV